jgi:hypothetical protein
MTARRSERGNREKVLDLLRNANGAWVKGEALAIGGVEGTRRFRELRQMTIDGTVEVRRSSEPGRWEYRLVMRQPSAQTELGL